MPYEPPYRITARIASLCIEIAELVGKLDVSAGLSSNPRLHHELRIKTIHSSLAIEQNTLGLDQVTAIIEGRRVLGPANEILEVSNAQRAYNLLNQLDPHSLSDLLRAHSVMMNGLRADAGMLRSKDVGVFDGEQLIHAGTPAAYVPQVMADLFEWVASTHEHPLIASCVFHYEFEFIHPFSDGNGRTGRLWQTLMLAHWRPALAWLPVETVINERQAGYYAAFNASNTAGDSTAFVTFMLEAIRDALRPFVGDPAMRDEQRLLRYFAAHPSGTIKEAARELGISQRSAERLVSNLKASGSLIRTGSARKGFWKVVAPNYATICTV